jgi:hypothetical protein
MKGSSNVGYINYLDGRHKKLKSEFLHILKTVMNDVSFLL